MILVAGPYRSGRGGEVAACPLGSGGAEGRLLGPTTFHHG